jgi:hypothetical protein
MLNGIGRASIGIAGEGEREINQPQQKKRKEPTLKVGHYERDDVKMICDTRGKLRRKFGGFGEGVEGGDGLDEAGDGEGVEDAPGFTDEMKHAAFATEGDGHTDKRGDAGAVDLRHAVEIDDDLARTVLENSGKRSGELVAGIADGEAAVNVKNVYAVLFADVNFNGSVLGHRD